MPAIGSDGKSIEQGTLTYNQDDRPSGSRWEDDIINDHHHLSDYSFQHHSSAPLSDEIANSRDMEWWNQSYIKLTLSDGSYDASTQLLKATSSVRWQSQGFNYRLVTTWREHLFRAVVVISLWTGGQSLLIAWFPSHVWRTVFDQQRKGHWNG